MLVVRDFSNLSEHFLVMSFGSVYYTYGKQVVNNGGNMYDNG